LEGLDELVLESLLDFGGLGWGFSALCEDKLGSAGVETFELEGGLDELTLESLADFVDFEGFEGSSTFGRCDVFDWGEALPGLDCLAAFPGFTWGLFPAFEGLDGLGALPAFEGFDVFDLCFHEGLEFSSGTLPEFEPFDGFDLASLPFFEALDDSGFAC
jgi:hypothetical protein